MLLYLTSVTLDPHAFMSRTSHHGLYPRITATRQVDVETPYFSSHVPYRVPQSPEAPRPIITSRSLETSPPARHADQHREDDKRHACPYCPRRFNRPSSLAIHLNTHTGAKREFFAQDAREVVHRR